MNSDWFSAPFAPVVIGRSNYFGKSFETRCIVEFDGFACEGSLLFAYNKSLNNNNYIIPLKFGDFIFH